LPDVAGQADNRMVTLQQAAQRLGVSEWNVKRMIDRKVLPATQAVPLRTLGNITGRLELPGGSTDDR